METALVFGHIGGFVGNQIIWRGQCKIDITPMRKQWRYVFFMPWLFDLRYVLIANSKIELIQSCTKPSLYI